MRIGFHTNLKSYLANPYPKVGAIQVFIGRPISFWPSEIANPEEVKARIKELDLNVYVHAPYVYSLNHKENTASGNEKLSKIMESIGLKYMVVHCQGEHSVDDWKWFMESQIWNPEMVLLENMAKGSFKTLSEIEEISESCGCGICLDTCHLWNSGDTTTIKDWSRVKLVHCNVADGQFGGKKDNHTKKSISEGNVDWIQNEILSKVNCDIISETSDPVDLIKELQLINEIYKK